MQPYSKLKTIYTNSPESLEVHKHDPCVEAPPDCWPGPVVLPKLARDVPVALVLNQADRSVRAEGPGNFIDKYERNLAKKTIVQFIT